MQRAARRVVLGFLIGIAGSAIYFWARTHSPQSGYFVAPDRDYYAFAWASYPGAGFHGIPTHDYLIIMEPWYSGLRVATAGMGFAGLIMIAIGITDALRYRAGWDRIARTIAQLEPALSDALLGLRAPGNACLQAFPQNVHPKEETISAVAGELRSPFIEIRRWAADVLGQLGPKAACAVPSLIREVADSNDGVRLRAVRALGSIGKAATPAVPALVATWAREGCRWEREDEVLTVVTRSLALTLVVLGFAVYFGSRVATLLFVTGVLIILLLVGIGLAFVGVALIAEIALLKTASGCLMGGDPRWECYNGRDSGPQRIYDAIKAIKSEPRMDFLNALNDKDVKVRRAMARAIEHEFGEFFNRLREITEPSPDLTTLVSGLVQALDDADEEVRRLAASALGDVTRNADGDSPGIGRTVETAVMALAAALNDRKSSVRQAAARALENGKAKSAPAKPALLFALKDRDPCVRACAVESLRFICQPPESAVPHIIAALDERRIRGRAVFLLGEMSVGKIIDAKSAVPEQLRRGKEENSPRRA